MSRRDRVLINAITVVAGAVLLVVAGPAAADSRTGSGPNWNPPRPNGQPASAPTPHGQRVAAPVSVVLAVRAERPRSPAVSVTIRGPEGGVTRYQLEEGATVIRPREIVIHPGEALTLRVLPSAPAR